MPHQIDGITPVIDRPAQEVVGVAGLRVIARDCNFEGANHLANTIDLLREWLSPNVEETRRETIRSEVSFSLDTARAELWLAPTAYRDLSILLHHLTVASENLHIGEEKTVQKHLEWAANHGFSAYRAAVAEHLVQGSLDPREALGGILCTQLLPTLRREFNISVKSFMFGISEGTIPEIGKFEIEGKLRFDFTCHGQKEQEIRHQAIHRYSFLAKNIANEILRQTIDVAPPFSSLSVSTPEVRNSFNSKRESSSHLDVDFNNGTRILSQTISFSISGITTSTTDNKEIFFARYRTNFAVDAANDIVSNLRRHYLRISERVRSEIKEGDDGLISELTVYRRRDW